MYTGREIPQQRRGSQAVEEELIETLSTVIPKAVVGNIEQVDEGLEDTDVDSLEGFREGACFEDVVGDVALPLLIGAGFTIGEASVDVFEHPYQLFLHH